MQTQLRIMRGRDLAQRVAREARHAAACRSSTARGRKPTQLAVGIALVKYYAMWPYRLITSTQADTPIAGPSESGDRSRAIPTRCWRGWPSNQVRGSQLVDMTFSAADPEFAARAANVFADEYVGQQSRAQGVRRSRRAPSG